MILALNTAQNIHELALLSSATAGAADSKLLAERRWVNAKEDVEKLVPTVQELLSEASATKQDLTGFVVVRGPGSFTSVRVGVAFMNALAEGLSTAHSTAAHQTPVHLYAMDTFELLALKAPTTRPLLVVLHAGGLDVAFKLFEAKSVPAHAFVQNNASSPVHETTKTPSVHETTETTQVGPLATLLAKFPHGQNFHVAAELPETLTCELRSITLEKEWQFLAASDLKTLGEALVGTISSAPISQELSHPEPTSRGLVSLTPINTALPLYLKSAHITVSKDPWKSTNRLL